MIRTALLAFALVLVVAAPADAADAPNCFAQFGAPGPVPYTGGEILLVIVGTPILLLASLFATPVGWLLLIIFFGPSFVRRCMR
jgi:hypothetical protein